MSVTFLSFLMMCKGGSKLVAVRCTFNSLIRHYFYRRFGGAAAGRKCQLIQFRLPFFVFCKILERLAYAATPIVDFPGWLFGSMDSKLLVYLEPVKNYVFLNMR